LVNGKGKKKSDLDLYRVTINRGKKEKEHENQFDFSKKTVPTQFPHGVGLAIRDNLNQCIQV
jgi:hypothetical protein